MCHILIAVRSPEMREQLHRLLPDLARMMGEGSVTTEEVDERPDLVSRRIAQGFPQFLVLHEDFIAKTGPLWLAGLQQSRTLLIVITGSKYRRLSFRAGIISEEMLSWYGDDPSFTNLLEELRAAGEEEP